MAHIRDYFGPYRLIRLLRSGRFSEVWEAAKDGETNGYALKIIKREMLRNSSRIAALKHEAEIGKRLEHPNIISIYGYAVEQDTSYLVMELFSARNLKIALRDGHPESFVPKFIWQAAEALYHLHEQGFIHCDVKPDNFLVGRAEEVKLIDFALARSLRRSMFAGVNPFTWFAKKTPSARDYGSPEQIRGQRLDVRADIYSFGCTLFELVSGTAPYSGTSSDDLLKNHLGAPIPALKALNSKVTSEFSDLVRNMMAKQPAERPPSIFEFLKEFRGIRVFKQPPDPPGGFKLPRIGGL